MPMIDVYAVAGTFGDKHQLAVDLARTLMTIEEVPNIPMFRQNTAAFVHELDTDSLANVDGDNTYVRVQVLTNHGALDRRKQTAGITVVAPPNPLRSLASDADGIAAMVGAIDGPVLLAGHSYGGAVITQA